MRQLRCAWVLVCGAAAVLGPVGSARADEPLRLVPPGFTLRATHGYRMSVLGAEGPQGGAGVVIVTLRSRRASVTYSAPAAVTPGSIEADLGSVGRIDVDFVPSGRTRTERSSCGRSALVESGRYEGTIDFKGEDGYSEVRATSAQGEASAWLNLICASGGSEGIGGHSPGARLTVRHSGAGGFEFSAMKNSPRRPARFAASLEERRGTLRIERSAAITAAPGAFEFDVRAGKARVRPPRPFSGSASYRRRSGRGSRWRGNLRVDFPGRSGVRLTGRGTRASLIRAVLNPGHPF